MIFSWLLVAAAWADCPEPVSPASLGQDIAAGEGAYLNMEEDAFRTSWAAIQQQIPCLSEPVADTQVISFFRMAALHAFIERDEAAGTAALRALLARAPHYSLSPSLAPENHPLQQWMVAAFESPSTLTVPFDAPRHGSVWVDGLPAAGVVPADRPYLFQYAGEDGVMVVSALVQPGSAPPALGPARPERSLNLPLAVAGGITAIGAGSAYALARQREATFYDPTTPDTELDALRRQANSLSVLSVGAGTAALGLGAVVLFTGEW